MPTPIGHVANTPEILAAFEAAVRDGMDVVNFSGGGPQIDPANDALVEAVHDLAAAGVVTVIAAGNDRDEFGLGSAGSPGTAPDAISVAAVSNTHVFAPALDVTAPGAPDVLTGIPFIGVTSGAAPAGWGSTELVDVGTIVDTDGKSVDRHLCGSPGALDAADAAGRSLDGAIVLVDRGICPLEEKADRAKLAGAAGSSSPTTARARRTGCRRHLDPGRLDLEPRRRTPSRLAGRSRRPDDHPGRPQPLESSRPAAAAS